MAMCDTFHLLHCFRTVSQQRGGHGPKARNVAHWDPRSDGRRRRRHTGIGAAAILRAWRQIRCPSRWAVATTAWWWTWAEGERDVAHWDPRRDGRRRRHLLGLVLGDVDGASDGLALGDVDGASLGHVLGEVDGASDGLALGDGRRWPVTMTVPHCIYLPLPLHYV